jgi:hypothetical protein
MASFSKRQLSEYQNGTAQRNIHLSTLSHAVIHRRQFNLRSNDLA